MFLFYIFPYIGKNIVCLHTNTKPIKEVYALGGFGGYNHFFRAFKKEYGMTPKEYYESLTE